MTMLEAVVAEAKEQRIEFGLFPGHSMMYSS